MIGGMRRMPEDIEIEDEGGPYDSPFDQELDAPGKKRKRIPRPPTDFGELAEPPRLSVDEPPPDPTDNMFSGFAGGPMGGPPDPDRNMLGMMGDDELFGAVLKGIQSGKAKGLKGGMNGGA